MNARHCIGCGIPIAAPARLRCDSCELTFLRVRRSADAVRLREQRRAEKSAPLASAPGILRFRSRAVARQAKARGEILPQPCACCGDPNAQMHHPDYEEARLIVWLCVKHHHIWHRLQRAILPVLFEGWFELERAAAGPQNVANDPTFHDDLLREAPLDQAHSLLSAADWLAKNRAGKEALAS